MSFRGLHTAEANTASPLNITTCVYNQTHTEQEPKTSKTNLVASYISRTETLDGRTTVFEILKDNLRLFREPSATSCNLSVVHEKIDSQVSTSNGITIYDNRSLSSQAGYSFASPLVLSCETPYSEKSHLDTLSPREKIIGIVNIKQKLKNRTP